MTPQQIDAMKLALEALKWCHGGEPCGTAEAITALEEVLAEHAMREVQRLGQEIEQEPVAWIHNFIEGGISIGKRPADLNRHPDRWTALYKDPKPCPTCEALARTVMLDQTSHDTSPPQRKPLTDEAIAQIAAQGHQRWFEFARAIEAAHGIKE